MPNAYAASIRSEPVMLDSTASGVANDAGWFNLAGYFTLGYSVEPLAISLNLNGPPSDVQLCVANVEVRPVSAQ